MRKGIRYIILICLTVIMSTFIGCDGMPETVNISVQNAIQTRISENLELAKRLKDAGILSEENYSVIEKDIRDGFTKIQESLLDQDINDMSNILKAVTGWRQISYEDYKEDCEANGETPMSEDDFDAQYLTNSLMNIGASFLGLSFEASAESNIPVLGGNSRKVVPISIFSESTYNTLNEALGVPIYVLNTDVATSGGEGIDEITELIKRVSDGDADSATISAFNSYFVNSGSTLLNQDNPSQQIIRDSQGATGENNVVDPSEVVDIDTSSTQTMAVTDASDNQCGTDLTIFGTGEPLISIRIREFNTEAIDLLNRTVGISNSKYLVYDGKAYLMEYPLGYVEGFKETSDGSNYQAIIKKSRLGLNIKTGEFVKYNLDENGEVTAASTPLNDKESFYLFAGAENNEDTAKSSVVLYGETGISSSTAPTTDEESFDLACNAPWDLQVGYGNDGKFSTGRLVIRDYLEGTYAPDVVPGEKIVTLGRKLRILNFEGSKLTEVAKFYDMQGEEMDNSASLYVYDFADTDEIYKSNKVNYIDRSSSGSDTVEDSSDTESTEDTESIGDTGDNPDDSSTEESSTTSSESDVDSESSTDSESSIDGESSTSSSVNIDGDSSTVTSLSNKYSSVADNNIMSNNLLHNYNEYTNNRSYIVYSNIADNRIISNNIWHSYNEYINSKDGVMYSDITGNNALKHIYAYNNARNINSNHNSMYSHNTDIVKLSNYKYTNNSINNINNFSNEYLVDTESYNYVNNLAFNNSNNKDIDGSIVYINDTSDNSSSESESNSNNDESDDGLRGSLSKIDTLESVAVNEIKTTIGFPSLDIATADFSVKTQDNDTDRPIMYVMLVKANMFDTSLFSGWIQQTSNTENSLVWWNTWLARHDFVYSINENSLVNFLKVNFSTELLENDIIILNLETLSKIQQEYSDEDKQNIAEWLRTLFIVVGYALIAYGTILLLCWALDVNLDLGFNVLKKASFNKWVAVRYDDEASGMVKSDTKYVTFGKLLVSVFWIFLLGILLISVDIMQLIISIINLFGSVASYITDFISGAL